MTSVEIGETENPSKIALGLREDGVNNFNPRSRGAGESLSGLGSTVGVYYIEGYHDPADVIEKWMDKNYKEDVGITDWALHARFKVYGEEFRQASYERFSPFDEKKENGGANKDYRNQECGLCGNEYSGHRVRHLQECPER